METLIFNAYTCKCLLTLLENCIFLCNMFHTLPSRRLLQHKGHDLWTRLSVLLKYKKNFFSKQNIWIGIWSKFKNQIRFKLQFTFVNFNEKKRENSFNFFIHREIIKRLETRLIIDLLPGLSCWQKSWNKNIEMSAN